jgi:hypothetical protein
MTNLIYIEESDITDTSSMYEFVESGDEIIMKFYENDSQWAEHVRGKKAVTMKDTGDGVNIKFRNSKSKIELDYSQLVELMMLLKFHNEDSDLQSRYTHSFTKLLKVE